MKEVFKVHKLRDKMRNKPTPQQLTAFVNGKKEHGVTAVQMDEMKSIIERECKNQIAFLEREKNKLIK